ncbi:hypothetical protein [Spiroplasma endosymbiont of Atherix ibis]|uniref:hypothetical protein n=1 Tax=Spiroplasma endosymbiont of Atherix ibis TaxID=3066291 RepID=UPI0030CC645D
MRTAAYILFIISTISWAIFLIPLAWIIPMTIAARKSIGDGKEHIALGICNILFMTMPFGIVSGILLLIPE